jgi:predicted Zn-dependent protease
MRSLVVVAVLSLLAACGASPEQKLEQARGQLASGSYAEAEASAAAGLAAGAEGATAWRLELVALEAEARAKKTEAALARLERLAGAWAKQVGGSLFVQTAGQLREAGDSAGAIRVLDAGAKRFPEDADVKKAIAQAKVAGTDAEREQLRSLGYIE